MALVSWEGTAAEAACRMLGRFADDRGGWPGPQGERRGVPAVDDQAGGGGVGVEVGQVVFVEFGQGVPGQDAGVLG